jgi:hypothetical protein
MKLIQAIRAIEKNGRMKSMKEHGKMNIVYIQSVFPQEDIIALKRITREPNIKDAISKAVYHYLECNKTDEDDR